MPANRCSLCAFDWPRDPAYRFCPQCGEKTDPVSNIEAMNEDEARTLRLHFKFEKFYEAWDGMRPASRLEPD